MTPEGVRLLVSRILTIGVAASAVLMAGGLVGSLFVGWSGSLTNHGGFVTSLSDFGAVLGNILAGRPVGLAQAGLITLIATPPARVAASAVAFGLEGDHDYAVITIVVLIILTTSLIILR
jgi:uncharacterized membrane protein